jgi:hypothetical protein
MSHHFVKKAASVAALLLTPLLMQAQTPGTDPLPPAPGSGVTASLPTPPPAACSAGETPGTWCTVTTPLNFPGTMLLLTDGRVMAIENGAAGSCGPGWQLLTPSSSGHYGSGTWAATAPMATPRLYFASTVMQNGQVWVLGGEYSTASCSSSGLLGIIPTGEVYDPVGNTWTALTPYPNTASCIGFRGVGTEACFGDDPSSLLQNGSIIAGDIFTGIPQIWTGPAPGTWAPAATKANPGDSSDEEGWAKLPNGNILVYDLFNSISTGSGKAEIYNPTANTWTKINPSDLSANGTLPVLSSSLLGYEMGPPMRLQDGRIFEIGANQHTALYTPSTNTWAAGPDTLGNAAGGCTVALTCAYGADDAPAAELPSGHVVFAADSGPNKGIFTSPTCLFDFNPSTNTTSVFATQPPDLTGCLTNSANSNNSIIAFPLRMLMLPTGQLLYHNGGQTANVIYLYTPTSTLAAPPYRPVVQSVTGTLPTLTVTGLQLNGQSAGSYYGDDVVTDENYPIVRLVNAAGTVFYCKTTNWSSVGVGNVGTETVTVSVPGAVLPGSYSMVVSGAGVQSVPVAVTLQASVGN